MSDKEEEEEDEVDDGPYYDIIILHSETETDLAKIVCKKIMQINLGDDTFPVIDTLENVLQMGSQEIDELDYAVEHATFIMFFRTKAFFEDEIRRFAVNAALDNAITSMEKSRRWSLIPLDVGNNGRKTKIRGKHCLNSLSGLSVTKQGDFDEEKLRRTLILRKQVRLDRELRQKNRATTRRKEIEEGQAYHQHEEIAHTVKDIEQEGNGDTFVKTLDDSDPEQRYLDIINPSMQSEGENALAAPFAEMGHSNSAPYSYSSDDASMSSESMSRSSSCMSTVYSQLSPDVIPMGDSCSASRFGQAEPVQALGQAINDLTVSDFEQNAYGSAPFAAVTTLSPDAYGLQGPQDTHGVISATTPTCQMMRPSSLSEYSLVVEDQEIPNDLMFRSPSSQHLQEENSVEEEDGQWHWQNPLLQQQQQQHMQGQQIQLQQLHHDRIHPQQQHQQQQHQQQHHHDHFQQLLHQQQEQPIQRQQMQHQQQQQQQHDHPQQLMHLQQQYRDANANVAFPDLPRYRDPREADLFGRAGSLQEAILDHQFSVTADHDSGRGISINSEERL